MRRAFAELDEREPNLGRFADHWAWLAHLLEVQKWPAPAGPLFQPLGEADDADGED